MPVPAFAKVLCDGIMPDGSPGTFFIRTTSIDKVLENGPIWKVEDIGLLPEIVSKPDKIYEDLGRPECFSACCYSAEMQYRLTQDRARIQAPRGAYFVVFADPISGGMCIWDWAWRPEDKDHPGNPTGWESFRKGKVWPKP